LWVLPPLAFAAPLKLSAWSFSGALFTWMILWALLSYLHPQRQFLHDAMAGTRLVDASTT
jgi:hypothetical protein